MCRPGTQSASAARSTTMAEPSSASCRMICSGGFRGSRRAEFIPLKVERNSFRSKHAETITGKTRLACDSFFGTEEKYVLLDLRHLARHVRRPARRGGARPDYARRLTCLRSASMLGKDAAVGAPWK